MQPLTNIAELLQFLTRFLWLPSPNHIVLYRQQIREVIKVARDAQEELSIKQDAIDFAIQNCPTCSNQSGSPALCAVCARLQLAGANFYSTI